MTAKITEDSVATMDRLIPEVRERLAKNQRVRRNLPGGGRLRIDRQLPFLCVYRSPPDRDDAGTMDLVTTEAAYLFAPGDDALRRSLSELCRAIGQTLREHFGVFLYLEIWSAVRTTAPSKGFEMEAPAFRIHVPSGEPLPIALTALQTALQRMTFHHRPASVELVTVDAVTPPGLPALSGSGSGSEDWPGCFWIGLEVHPFYRNSASGAVYPMVLLSLRRQLAPALRQLFFAFSGSVTEGAPTHYEAMGPSSFVRAASEVDQQLYEVSQSFDLLLQVTPVNADAAWREFQRTGYRKEPTFYYRPLPFSPHTLKERLFRIAIDRIEDSTMAYLFAEKQEELDRQISALRDIETPNYVYDSLQLYGVVESDLLQLAERVLHSTEPASWSSLPADLQDVNKFVRRLTGEIERYRACCDVFDAEIEIRDDIASGIMVSRNRVFVSPSIRVSKTRMEALVHHEVGTHVVTYVNGQMQPFAQLCAGLAGYEALQEGLAVLSEHLVGGLSVQRMRTLAGRVVAAHSRLENNSFVETFDRLHHTHALPPRTAFVTTLRAYRAGGTTKDAVYLRGLKDLLSYLADGREIEPLFVGKIALSHVPFIQELRRRGVTQPPAILPVWLTAQRYRRRLEACRGMAVTDLLKGNDDETRLCGE